MANKLAALGLKRQSKIVSEWPDGLQKISRRDVVSYIPTEPEKEEFGDNEHREKIIVRKENERTRKRYHL